VGFLGPNAPLPLHLSEYALERAKHAGDATFIRFLDIFYHRFLSFFYRAFAAAAPTVSFDRPEKDRFALYVGATFGLGMKAWRNRDLIADHDKLYYSGRFAAQPRNADGLRAVIRDFLEMPTSIEEFVGEWSEIPEPMRWRLGSGPPGSMLGRAALLGERVWHCQGRFRIVLGPVDGDQLQRILPGSEILKHLMAWVRNYVGDGLTWDVRVILSNKHRQSMRLGAYSRLGWGCWMGKRDSDAGLPHQDVVLDPLRTCGPGAIGEVERDRDQ
jgi:type VI secretion system protein ImpH